MFRILKKSLKTGVVTGQHPAAAPVERNLDIGGKRESQAVPFLAGISRRRYWLVQCL